jgi:hypothetical protein
MDDHVLVLVSLGNDRVDAGGNEYPKKGLVGCKKYERDKNIRTGLYGTLWGEGVTGKWYLEGPNWCVVKTRNNEEIVFLDKACNLIKFAAGAVVHDGTQESCMEFIRISRPAATQTKTA